MSNRITNGLYGNFILLIALWAPSLMLAQTSKTDYAPPEAPAGSEQKSDRPNQGFPTWVADLAAAGACGFIGASVGPLSRARRSSRKSFEAYRKAEAIKAQIASETWVKQMVWQQKRDAYTNLQTQMQALLSRIVSLRSHVRACEMWEASQSEDSEAALPTEHQTAALLQINELANTQNTLMAELVHADIFVGLEGVKAIARFRDNYSAQLSEITTSAQCAAALGFILATKNDFALAARKDLGVDL